jgi:hypothetical protein
MPFNHLLSFAPLKGNLNRLAQIRHHYAYSGMVRQKRNMALRYFELHFLLPGVTIATLGGNTHR